MSSADFCTPSMVWVWTSQTNTLSGAIRCTEKINFETPRKLINVSVINVVKGLEVDADNYQQASVKMAYFIGSDKSYLLLYCYRKFCNAT